MARRFSTVNARTQSTRSMRPEQAPGRLLVELSGRPGELGFYGTPTDGRFVYFVWTQDLGDLWVMDSVSATR